MMRPATEAELAEAIRRAAQPLAIRGGGTRGPQAAGEVLETGAIRGVTLYEPGALTLVVRAGTPLAEVEASLAAEGQRLPFEVPDLRALLRRDGASTIGGVVAENASGPRRVQAGACRDSLIGLRFVDGQGAVIRNGGRVMKNVTGYDLVKLLAGSRGRLGVLTEVAFKLLPVPEVARSLLLPGLDAGGGVAAMSAALGSPYEVSGAAWLPGQGVILRLEGFADSVAYRAGRLQAALAPFGAVQALPDDPWPAIRDVTRLAGRPGDLWRISLRPSQAAGVLERIAAEDVVLDWGGGLIWVLVAPGTDLRARAGAFDGHATRLRAEHPGDGIADLPPEAPGVAALTAGLKARFDPRNLLNRGL